MHQAFTAASHHDVLVLLLQIALLLLVARAFGELAQRFKQPAVMGEILAGIVLGPSFLSSLVPPLDAWLVPHTATQGYLLEEVGMFGAIFLLLITGLEVDVGLIRRHAKTALSLAAGGFFLPFISGFLLSLFLPRDLFADPNQPFVFSLFVATAMSISAIAVIGKVLRDLNMFRRDIGQIILAVGMIDDTLAWLILSIVVGLASGSAITAFSLFTTIGKVFAFFFLSFTLGRWFIKKTLDFVQHETKSSDALLTVIIVLTFFWSAITQALHLEMVMGAFVIGIVFSLIPTFPDEVTHTLERLALGIFSPIFFAIAGLKVNLLNFFDLRLLGFALLVIAVACFGKLMGIYVSARFLAKSNHWTALCYGSALNARGAVEIIIATIGLSLGILSQNMFSMIVLMAIATSLLAPVMLRWALRHVPVTEEEEERLHREELAQRNLFANVRRVLVPIRGRANANVKDYPAQSIEAHILEQLQAKIKPSVTLLTIAPDNENRDKVLTSLTAIGRQMFRHQDVTPKVTISASPLDAILDEAKKGYDLMFLGAPRGNGGTEVLFTPIIDQLVRLAPCSTLVIHGQVVAEDWKPQRILVPTNGSRACRHAAEAGFALASVGKGQVWVLKVVEEEKIAPHLDSSGAMKQRQLGVAHEMVEELCDLGNSEGVLTHPHVRVCIDAETGIFTMARDVPIDLIILGINVRAGERLYLGARVERILREAPCPVMIVNAMLN